MKRLLHLQTRHRHNRLGREDNHKKNIHYLVIGRNGATITLAHNEEVTMTGIPAGYTYTVTEKDEAGYTPQVTEGAYTGDITADETIAVTYTNTLENEDITSFRLKKALAGNYENADESYAFLISLSGLQSGKSYSITGDIETTYTANENGKAQIELELSLKDGMTCKLLDLPLNARYTVTEAACPRFIAEYSIEGNNGSQITQSAGNNTVTKKELSTAKETVDANDNDVRITFTNTYTASDFELPSAGFDDARMLIAAALAGMLLFAAMYIVSRGRDTSQ